MTTDPTARLADRSTPDRSSQDRSRQDRPTQWRWYIAGAVLLLVLVALGLVDRSSRVPDTTAPPTTGTTDRSTATTRPGVTQRALPPTRDTQGTLFVLGEDETLTEVDLTTGRSREATLTFPVETWFANQAVPLQQAILVVTRRQVWSVDRETLRTQRRVGTDVWVAAAPDGSWAALVPFNGAGQGVTLLDAQGAQSATLNLPPGVDVVGVTDEFVVVDAAGTIRLLDRGGRPATAPDTLVGRPFAVGTSTIARVVCTDARTCELRSGTIATPDLSRAEVPTLGGRWVFGPAGIVSSDDRLIGFAGTNRRGDTIPRVFDLQTGRTVDGPEPFGRVGPITPMAFTPDGTAVVQSTATGVSIWKPGADGNAAILAQLPFEAEVLAVGTSPEPPPPDQPSPAGPPPSYA